MIEKLFWQRIVLSGGCGLRPHDERPFRSESIGDTVKTGPRTRPPRFNLVECKAFFSGEMKLTAIIRAIFENIVAEHLERSAINGSMANALAGLAVDFYGVI